MFQKYDQQSATGVSFADSGMLAVPEYLTAWFARLRGMGSNPGQKIKAMINLFRMVKDSTHCQYAIKDSTGCQALPKFAK